MDVSAITNNPQLGFKSLETECFRVYVFPGGHEIRIDGPVALNVSASGGHRVLDVCGVSHYIPPTWIHLWWVTKKGHKPFSF